MRDKVLMKGNEAIGEAAVRAGCLNYFAYPITPQTEVAEYLAKRLPQEGGAFVQGESEVAVGYMIYGAAAVGERVMTTSSSPGISLMSEALSYIAGARLPVVLANIVRGGPGLGGILPSQADYNQATRGGGHGGYHMMVLAPEGVQEAVDMTMEAFPLAEKYRIPVMLLGDGLIGQMMEPVSFPEHLDLTPRNKDNWAVNGIFKRGGGPRNLIKTLFLDPDDLNAHNLLLKSQYTRMKEEEVRFESYNTEGDYEALIVSFGTISRVCKTAISTLKAQGVEVGLIRPQTLYPFPEKAIHDAAAKKSCQKVVCVELNMGQMVNDVDRSVKGKKEVSWFGECGGNIPPLEAVADHILSLLR